MDINFYLQKFEASMVHYSGDDPLDAWDKFVDFLDSTLAPEEKSGLSVVLDHLVQKFLQDKRYQNDIRYINHCLKCASYYPDPIKVYSFVHSHGIGTQAAALYVAWALQFESTGLLPQAEQVFQRALENQAEPLEMVQQQYRLFQSRVKSQVAPSDHVRNPLQNSQLLNQNPRQREAVQPQCKELEDSPFPADKTIRIISRSENNPKPNRSTEESVSMYCVAELVCEGSELSFEELRAMRYFTKCRERELQQLKEEALRRCEEEEEEVERMKKMLEELNSKLQQESNLLEPCTPQGQLLKSTPAPAPVCLPVQPPSSLPQHTHMQTSRPDTGLQPKHERPLVHTRLSESHLFSSSASVPVFGRRMSLSAASFSALRTHTTHTDTHTSVVETPSSTQTACERENVCIDGLQHSTVTDPHTRSLNPLQTAEQRTRSACVSRAETQETSVCLGQSKGPVHSTSVQQRSAPERDASGCGEAEGDAVTDTSQGAFNLSHVTPNTSLGLITATPSRALPSPTVNTREALDVIMDMFQAPTLLQDTLFHTTIHTAEDSFEKSCRVNGFAPSFVKPASSAPFRIYQDESDENKSVVQQPMEKAKPASSRALLEIPVSKANDTPVVAESLTEDSAMWGARYTSMAACPNHTRDFALAAHIVSTPLHPAMPFSWDPEQSQENAQRVFSGVEENPFLRQPAKLSPILEQSPPEENASQMVESSLRAQGTIVGEGVSLPPQTHTMSLTQHNMTTCNTSRQPLAPLAFSDHTAVDEAVRGLSSSSRPSWSIYQSPVRSNGELDPNSLQSVRMLQPEQVKLNRSQPNPVQTHSQELSSNSMYVVKELKADQFNWSRTQHPGVDVHSGQEEADLLLPKRSFHRRKSEKSLLENQEIPKGNLRISQTSCVVPSSPKLDHRAVQDVPMSPQPAPGFGWLQVDTPPRPTEPDLDLMLTSPQTSQAVPRPTWNIYQSPERPGEPHPLPPRSPDPTDESGQHALEQSGLLLSKRSFNRRKSDKRVLQVADGGRKSILMSPKAGSNAVQDVPMSPAPGLNWLCSDSPAKATEPDLDVMMSPQCMSKTQQLEQDMDVSMSPLKSSTANSTPAGLVSDPWNEDLIASLLSKLQIPLSSYPSLSTWTCNLPTITPKMTVQMAEESLRVDFVLGEGAFATVYQATNLTTSQKFILKVQKPANPWEFYINTQLNVRVQPSLRHLYNRLHCAHLFTNGSVLLGELHNCGTLLNVVNLYKSRNEKVMPQPLVLYFTVCILHMVELLHKTNIIHADIKPDNVLLGERFLKNENFDVEDGEHGLVLIDFGQSIDMTLFPEGTAFTARCMTSGFQCTEMLSGRPWTYQTDYYGIAGTVHCLMFGSYMQVRNEGGVWKTNGVFKRNPHSELWQEFFHTLLNVPDCSSLLCLHSLRLRLSAALQENYSNKLRSLKSRLAVQILETRSSRR